MAVDEATARVDSWIWSVRLTKTRALAAAACRAGHVRINGERVKPAHPVKVGDEVRVRQDDWTRVVVVSRVLSKRVGASVAVECFVDNSPPRPAALGPAPVAVREHGAGRPTKRDRRALEQLFGRPGG
ncbi:S4 domain-containing protein [Kitasatospora sp. NBC_01287]|uniref:RNA-binding S4 domain-containing protein n=1 Tax=Kitasatospora sp. NBC_01287 TaxID=2903573 RepID=UPI002255C0D1|nr:S4 domain-containing protein [Kitasatospora sp. NBC_01287]MCX4745605.1 S4 domain-containing protein [Kitasatospora sp. NBC_01287]